LAEQEGELNNLNPVLKIAAIAVFSVLAIYAWAYYINLDRPGPFPEAENPRVAQQPTTQSAEGPGTDNKTPAKVFYYKQPPYVVTKGGPKIHLVNDPGAQDPTWQQLKDFIASDNTDSKAYDLRTFPCGAFAQEVHNNAEAHGIKAAWVAVDFENDSIGHALNAFQTRDRGLVYVDCTGYRGQNVPVQTENSDVSKVYGARAGSDSVAYLEIGKEYGLISMAVATSPDYEAYIKYKDSLLKFKSDLASYNESVKEYNAEVKEYNRWVNGTTIYWLTPEAKKADRWKAELDGKSAQLKKTSLSLDKTGDSLGTFWQPDGIVENIEIYW
jgi:hypothetical protein